MSISAHSQAIHFVKGICIKGCARN